MRRVLLLVVLSLLATVVAVPSAGADGGPELWVPTQVTDEVSWTDSYGDPRGGGRSHRGVDMMAPQMTPVVAAHDGYIHRAYGGDSRECLDGGVCSSYGFLIYGDDGWSTFYLHLNGDTPGRPNGCDSAGGAEGAFSPRLVEILRERGTLEPLPRRYDPQDVVRVEQGEVIGYVGSSGNAGCGNDHLHFELWQGHDFKSADDPSKSNPTPYVDAARDAGRMWGPNELPEPVPTERLAGETRVETAVSLSRNTFDAADVAVIAPARSYAEALLAAPLAAAFEAPVLITWSDELADGVADEVSRLGATSAVVVGDEDAVSAEVIDALVARTSVEADRVRRLAGADRYELSAQIAEELLVYHGWTEPEEPEQEEDGDAIPFLRPASNDRSTVHPVVALGEHPDAGRSWPDALASTVLAARETVPILLVRPDELPDATRRILRHDGIGNVRIVGGPGAVSTAVERQIAEEGLETSRLAGDDRYATALAIADYLQISGASLEDVFVATGRNYPDALAAGVAIARQGRLMVLVDGDNPYSAEHVYGWLHDRAGDTAEVTAVGGPAAIGQPVLDRIALHAGWPAQD